MMEIRKRRRQKTSVLDKVFVVCNTLFMIAFVVVTLYPVLNTLAISFNDGTDALRGGIYLLPRKFSLKNYRDCGTIIYDINKQPVFAGGSGPVCSALVMFSYIVSLMDEGKYTEAAAPPRYLPL